MKVSQQQIVYIASIFALITAGALAWAVAHPCDCAHDEETVETTE
jgi:hypothetical protein